jgi:hypothetical protein
MELLEELKQRLAECRAGKLKWMNDIRREMANKAGMT